ncbi:MAG TPA: IS200/IS605 family transposase [Pyrinomonadaceae bacterium]|nr:IS200/IS605 family transposase [Pyrinomonadaceae bacterium]
MPHSYVSNLIHYVFSTKERCPFIDQALESRLWPYTGGIARENGMIALAIGGTSDHLHTLISLPATMSVAKAVQLLKGGSSKWVHDSTPDYQKFSWQEGYGAFSVSASQKDKTIAYIRGQKEHHRRRTFQEEFLEFLNKHGVDYDPHYVF